MTDGWIVIPNWDKFQHRDAWRSRVPTWICDYTEQTSREDYRALSLADRGLLHGIRTEYARSRGRLPASTLELSRRLGVRAIYRRQLKTLSDAGFIEIVAGRPAGIPASNVAGNHARLEERREELTQVLSVSSSLPSPSLSATDADDDAEAVAAPPLSATRKTSSGRPRTTVYQRAEMLVRNAAWQYPPDLFVDELQKFNLSRDEVERLQRLRDELVDEEEAMSW